MRDHDRPVGSGVTPRVAVVDDGSQTRDTFQIAYPELRLEGAFATVDSLIASRPHPITAQWHVSRQAKLERLIPHTISCLQTISLHSRRAQWSSTPHEGVSSKGKRFLTESESIPWVRWFSMCGKASRNPITTCSKGYTLRLPTSQDIRMMAKSPEHA